MSTTSKVVLGVSVV
ncbi:hypothetical protein FQN60_007110 [Etheostoma spectabile]|nr:hypothetical protein FQN60_007110 [Etheostoma spectabile]